jgi:hypothetical protein
MISAEVKIDMRIETTLFLGLKQTDVIEARVTFQSGVSEDGVEGEVESG